MPSNDVFANVRDGMVAMQNERHRVKKERQKRIPELKAESHQVCAKADEIRAQANQFMADAHKANAKIKAESHQVRANANQFMADAHAANAVLKAHVCQFRAEVNRMVGAYAQVSRERAAAWKQTLNAVRGRKPGRVHPGAPGRRG